MSAEVREYTPQDFDAWLAMVNAANADRPYYRPVKAAEAQQMLADARTHGPSVHLLTFRGGALAGDMLATRDMRWTVFRPTLIYGRGMDRNVSLIRRLVRIAGFFPLLGSGSGLRQPVHADDLAAACVAALDNPLAFDKAYDLSGGETLTYRAMVGRIFDSLSHKPRFLSVPQALFTGALRMLSLIPRYRDFNIAMAQRMNEDLVYEHSEATRDFGFQPKKFTP